ncbi:MAG: ATP-binding cassette domain-containing protein [Candidatus Delongbacteria bacterium]|nr:ATP-binding cassette domain-containing protein [Candidatus Delongbacteria bacterium]MBN2835065.1 ATP-binding cassette domain-containing protein [Candidatus Delongbacteria bacterium]
MIEVSNVTRFYGPTKALDNLSVTINSGEITGILGPNGAGKTTLLKIITCYMYPTNGDVKVNEHNIFDHSEEIRAKLGYLPEHAPIYTDTTVYDYLDFVAGVRKIPKNERHDAIKKVCEKTGLKDVAFKKIDQLSKGYRQRVGIAQALIHDPEILILDEPTTGLDPNQILEIRSLIKELGKNKTVIFSTHILQEVQALCDRVIILKKGNIVADASPEKLQTDFAGRDTINLEIKSDKDLTMDLKSIYSVENIIKKDKSSGCDYSYKIEYSKGAEIRENIFDVVMKNNAKIVEMHREKATMEDIFKELTVG